MKEFLERQYKNLFLWAPFVVAFGAALYFSLGQEPFFRFPILITFILCAIIYKNKSPIIRYLALFMFGFFYSMSFTQIINTPQIKDSFGAIPISGKITNIDYTPDKTRLFIRVLTEQIDSKLQQKYTNIRVSISDNTDNINIGDTINGKAMLFHPSPKYAPGAFDFARWAYFTKLSGTGFLTEYEIIPQKSSNQNIRTYIHNKSKSFLTDSLVLGYKNVIPDSESKIWKSIGIGHVWSISGFHMTLVGGWLFALFYLLFRSIAPITKRIPAKYPAMICAWFGLLFYLFISGISVATIRAFLMTTLIFIAIIFGRNILSLRNAALAFLVLFLINPFFVMHAGIQLSFAAIFGLIWFFNDKEYEKRNFTKRLFHILYLSFMTALIATIFTMPFIIAHFGYIPLYSLIGNIIILPIFSIIIMPIIMVGTMCALFNYHLLIDVSHNIYQLVLSWAQNITNLPHANISIPYMSNTVLMLCIFGLLCLILIVKPESKNLFIKNINYVLCAVFITLAIIINISTPKPLFYASSDHQLVGFIENGKLKFNKSRSSAHYFAFESWYKINGEEKPTKNKRYKCKNGFCRYNTKNWDLVYMQTFTSLTDNIEKVCNDKHVKFVITPFDITSQKCHAKIIQNGIVIYPNGSTKQIINHRPWHKGL